MYLNRDSDSKTGSIGTISLLSIFVLALLVGFITLGMWGCPLYKVYEQRKAGEAQLAHAQFSKEVAVAEAKAKMESAELLAQAEVLRARGVAKANEIIGTSLKDNSEYLKYLWINALERDPSKTVIYIPHDGGIPILEAGKRPVTDK